MTTIKPMTIDIWRAESPTVQGAVLNNFTETLRRNEHVGDITFVGGNQCTIGGRPLFYADTSEFEGNTEYVTRTYFLEWNGEMFGVR